MGESSSRVTGENEESSGRRAPSEGTIDESVLSRLQKMFSALKVRAGQFSPQKYAR